jgi:hypothetical protein
MDLDDVEAGIENEDYDAAALVEARRRRQLERALVGVRRGLRRALVLLLDLSESMALTDLKPNRLRCAADACIQFLSDFAAANPISQTAVIIIRDGKAIKLTTLGSPAKLQVSWGWWTRFFFFFFFFFLFL